MTADLINLGVGGRWRGAGGLGRGQIQTRDPVTPFKLAMVVIIEEHCKMIGEGGGGGGGLKTFASVTDPPPADSDLCSPYTDADECTFMITLLWIVQSPDLELNDLRHRLQTAAKPALLVRMICRLKEICSDGVHVLFDLMQNLQNNLLSGVFPVLHRTSVLGLFVRRISVAFEKLSFNQVIKLYNRFCIKFRETLREIPEKQTIEEFFHIPGQSMESHNESDMAKENMDSVDVGKYSQRQAEYFVAQQAYLLNHSELEALSPDELQKKIQELLQSNPDFAEAHFLSYMNYLRLHEYCGALGSLYEYFDQCQVLQGPPSSSSRSKTNTEDDVHIRNHRYAALNVAAMEFRFGHRKEAVAAIQEAIKLGQESNDSVCLQHALVWLHRLGIHNESGINFMLDKLVASSGELNLWYLTSLGIQSFVQHSYLISLQPSTVFEFLIKSDLLNIQHSLSDLAAVGYSQKASLWIAYGFSEMSLLNCQTVLQLNIQDNGIYHNTESECLAACQTARYIADQGSYDVAYEILASAKARFPASSQFSTYWIQCEEQLNFTLALLRGKQHLAEQAITNLAAVNMLEASFCRCLAIVDKGEGGRALELIENLMEECREMEASSQWPVTSLTIRLLLLKGNVLCAKGDAAVAVQPLVDAVNVSRRCFLSLTAAIAILHLAFVQYCLGMPGQALKLIEKVFVTVMSNGSLFDKERTKFLLIRCQVVACCDGSPAERQRELLSACEKLSGVVQSFQRLEAFSKAKEVLYFQGRLYHELGQIAERNKCALEFRLLDERFPTWHNLSINMF